MDEVAVDIYLGRAALRGVAPGTPGALGCGFVPHATSVALLWKLLLEPD
ncbi:hypothetical protein [Vitiosangium sp. GDMCC 1.1324]|nr:hypothetical protein [Vitiosangium sp. GDMCC 1.1324]